MNVFTPLVSIIIPVYNGSKYLKEAIDSALAQTYENIEVIVVNDGSNDKGATERLALSYGERIRYFHKENGGVATALNLAISKMKGEYFSWLSHDDVYKVDKVAAQVDFLNKSDKKNIILYSDYDCIDSESNYMSSTRLRDIKPEEFRLAFICGGVINGCTLLIPKECFEKVGVFDTALLNTQDYDLWFRLSTQYQFYHVPKCLVKFRFHPEQGSASTAKEFKDECENMFINFFKAISYDEIKQVYPKNPMDYPIIFAVEMIKSARSRAAWEGVKCACRLFLRKPGPVAICKLIYYTNYFLIRKLYYDIFRRN